MWYLRKVGVKMDVPHQTGAVSTLVKGFFQTQVDLTSFVLPEHKKKREPGNMTRHTTFAILLASISVLNS